MTVGHLGPDGEVWEEVDCRIITPVHLLIAALEAPGPAAELVAGPAPQSLHQAAGLVESPGPSGVSADLHQAQAWSSAQRWALDLGHRLEPEHLLAVLVNQAHPQVLGTLAAAGINPGELKRVGLGAVGLSPSAVCALQPLPPAGVGGVPPLPLEELPSEVWSDLTRRQRRLPLHRIKRRAQWYALLASEHVATGTILDSHGLNEDQRQSFLVHHRSAVEVLLAEAAPTVHAQILDDPGRRVRRRHHRHTRYRRLSGVLALLEGWRTSFGNRRSNLLRRWYTFTMPRR